VWVLLLGIIVASEMSREYIDRLHCLSIAVCHNCSILEYENTCIIDNLNVTVADIFLLHSVIEDEWYMTQVALYNNRNKTIFSLYVRCTTLCFSAGC